MSVKLKKKLIVIINHNSRVKLNFFFVYNCKNKTLLKKLNIKNKCTLKTPVDFSGKCSG